jgi:hypothetical protein
MVDPGNTPIATLTLIVGPAILTNASSVVATGVTARLARASDRGRELARQLEAEGQPRDERWSRRMAELRAVERRTLMLLASLRSFYVALGGFASAALFSLLGATLATMTLPRAGFALQTVGVLAGLVALAALVYGSLTLTRETRIAVQLLQDRADRLEASIEKRPVGDNGA